MKSEAKNKIKTVFFLSLGVVAILTFSKMLEFFYALFFSWIL